MHDTLIIGIVLILITLVLIGLHAQSIASFSMPTQDRSQYGAKVRPAIDSETIIQETIPTGREGVLYMDRYRTEDAQEKQAKFMSLITGGIDMHRFSAAPAETRPANYVVVNGKKCNGDVREITDVPIPDMTQTFRASDLLEGSFLKAVIARPYTRNLRDMRSSVQKRDDMRQYIDVKKGDRIIAPSFGGA